MRFRRALIQVGGSARPISREARSPVNGSARRLIPPHREEVTHRVDVLNNLKARRDQEEGFTLIELMVVVLIIAILIAIAIPTFLGARERAQDRAAQSSLRNALTAAKTAYTDNSDYSQST